MSTDAKMFWLGVAGVVMVFTGVLGNALVNQREEARLKSLEARVSILEAKERANDN